jgi:hypothetical protein
MILLVLILVRMKETTASALVIPLVSNGTNILPQMPPVMVQKKMG